MQASRTRNGQGVRFVARILFVLCSIGLLAQADDKKRTSSPPPKPAAPARAAAPTASKPAGGYGASASRGPSTGGSTRNGPTTGNLGGHTGPTANRPYGSGAKAAGPTNTGGMVKAPNTGGMVKAPNTGGMVKAPNTGGMVKAPNTGGMVKAPNTGGMVKAPNTGGMVKAPNTGGMVKAPNTGGMVGGHQTNTGLSGRPAPKGSQQTRLKNGYEVQKRPNGSVSDVHDTRRGLDVHHGLNGSRRVSVEHADHSRIVAERGRPGYVQRPYVYHGHEFARRTYYSNGRAYDRYYRGYRYHGVYMQVYAPVRYYPVAFYGWAYNPWYRPVVYPWGWVGSPWYGYYGYYFTPYPVYPTASLWLTDYLLAANLQAAYAAQQERQEQGAARQAPAGTAALTPEVKQMIADEVKNQIALENAEAQQNANNQELDPGSSSIARLLGDGHAHVFVVGSALDVVDDSGTECAISDGDVLKLVTPPAPSANEANLVVLSTKGGQECQKSAMVTVALADLQDMHNHMRETIDQGLQELHAKQGKAGLPAPPPSAMAAPVDTAFAQIAPPPDPNGIAEINQQLKEADQAEQDATSLDQQELGAVPPAPAVAPATITLGQSINEVTTILGPPVTMVDLGSKKIYRYKDMKVSFKGGKVSDVE